MRKKAKALAIVGLSLFLMGCDSSSEKNLTVEKTETSETEEEKTYTLSMESIYDMRENGTRVEDFYISNTGDAHNFYTIDDTGKLYGCGYNEYGQLGQGKIDTEYHEEMVLIAEDVVHVDYAQYGFAIYLTNSNELYGIGCNATGALLQNKKYEDSDYWNKVGSEITSPVLLMSDVAYARCGQNDVVALKNDGTVWTWGMITNTDGGASYEEQPKQILNDVRMITGGYFNHAAIKNDGTLWTWGYNYAGSCGSKEGIVINEPQKVADDVKMVWTGQINYSSPYDNIAAFEGDTPRQYENTIIEKENGEFYACGINLGDELKLISPYYESMEYETAYTSEFVRVELEEKNK